MPLIFTLLSGVAIGCMLLLLVKLMADFRHVTSARILMLIVLGAGCYVLNPLIANSAVSLTMNVISSAVPAFFWLFTVSFFQPRCQPDNYTSGLTSMHYLVVLTSLLVSIGYCFQHGVSVTRAHELFVIDHTIKFILVIAGLYNVLRNASNDLIECRRRVRTALAVASGTFMLFALVNAIIFAGQTLPEVLVQVNVSIITLLGLIKAYWILNARPEQLLNAIDSLPQNQQPQQLVSDTPIDSVDKAWLAQLSDCMHAEQYFRNHDVTIKSLSAHLEIPEHHLRRLINQHLGYRNFNEYLNHFRIEDASTRLRDPALKRTPVTSIAMESGYTSLTTFNKAFKAMKDMTPTEFRRQEHSATH